MAQLVLKDVGKIYVSDENVAVGIRGVNLSFERGEFVAVTGKSGSGKSTLLNVISGMDTYEEGEIYIDGEPTSHYLQPEWEQYREKYISFIFQDYNIIESFTVLQNVELALFNIEDKKERRERALNLIHRVGLSSHANQKGSKLSGGQKQRTVIARALAKNSPIILADEPTGNLDSETSKQIIELLREVSKDKLLILVTHNFDEVSEYATRHIRIFDGTVEFDHVIKKSEPSEKTEEAKKEDPKKTAKQNIKNGFILGRTIFTSKPKLSLFLCLLLIIGTFGIFMVTTFCGDMSDMFKEHYMFSHIDGRVILTTPTGQVISEDEIKKIKEDYGAEDYIRFDILIDKGTLSSAYIHTPADPENDFLYLNMEYTYGEYFGSNIIGRYPEKANEVLLYLPIYHSDEVGRDHIVTEDLFYQGMHLNIVGVKYYYDNNLTPKCLFTAEGFRTATALYYLTEASSPKISLSSISETGEVYEYSFNSVIPSFDMPADKIYVDSNGYRAFTSKLDALGVGFETEVDFTAFYYGSGDIYYYDDYVSYSKYAASYPSGSSTSKFEKVFSGSEITSNMPDVKKSRIFSEEVIIMSDELICEIAESILDRSYKQASLFFEDDKAAKDAAERLCDAGYIAVPSYTAYEPDAMSVIGDTLFSLMLMFVWCLAIVFLAFFINICSSKVLQAFKDEMAIMRSMGISVTVIRIGMYVRMLVSLIPAFILLAVGAFTIFTSPALNEHFVYLYAWQYALIILGVILLTVRITYKQIAKLFGESVKKSLRGGSAQ